MKATTRDAIQLPKVLDRANVHELRMRIEHAGSGAALVFDGVHLQRVETTGVQLLCALVLAAEGRGVTVTWNRVPVTLINYVKLLGIGDVIRFDDRPAVRRERRG